MGEYIKGPVTLIQALRDFAALAVYEFMYEGDKAIMDAQEELEASASLYDSDDHL